LRTLTLLPRHTALVVLSSPSAFTFTLTAPTHFGDPEYQALLANGQFAELFVSEGRIGNNATDASQHEVVISKDVNPRSGHHGQPVAEGDLSWGNGCGSALPFSLTYDGAQVLFSIGDIHLSTSAFLGSVNQLYLRAQAAGNAHTDSSVLLSSLAFNGTTFGLSLQADATTTDEVNYLIISGDVVGGAYTALTPFTLTGEARFTWTGTRPNNSALAFQIKAGNGTPSAISASGRR
jgi:hypothetical protein